ncbi:MAG TPA: AAA family ATPase, partial [Microlunatus sp.]
TTVYLDAVFGDRTGWAALAIGRNPYRTDGGAYRHRGWQELHYSWPEQRDDLAAMINIPDADAYGCPVLRHSPRRIEGNATLPTVLWADLDHPTIDQALLDKLEPLIVNSGSDDHLHAYIRLEHPTDIGRWKQLQITLRDRLGGDDKIATNDLLRLPGTSNQKPTLDGLPAATVTISNTGGRTWTADELADLLGITPDAITTPSARQGPAPAAEPVTPGFYPRWLDDDFEDLAEPPDRSAAFMTLINSCSSAGLTEGQTITRMSNWRPGIDKYGPRLADEVHRAWGKRSGRALHPIAEPALTFKTAANDTGSYEATQDLDAAHDDPEPETTEPSSWAPIDLGPIMEQIEAGTLERPEHTIGQVDGAARLFPLGRVSGIHGDSTAGKTWTACLCSVQQLAAGHAVIFIDFEDNEIGIAERLIQLGADPQAVSERFFYLNPANGFDLPALAEVTQLIEEHHPTLVIIDSTGEALAIEGLNENDSKDFAPWITRFPRRIARLGPAVLLLDHMAKAENGDGLWPVGSQRKRAAINGTQYLQKTVAPFSRTVAGHSLLRCAKDRLGHYATRQDVAELHIVPAGGRIHASLKAVTIAIPGNFRPTILMERTSRYLEAHPNEADRSQRQVRERVPGTEKTIIRALDQLIAEGYAASRSGTGRTIIYDSIKPFRDPSIANTTHDSESGGK